MALNLLNGNTEALLLLDWPQLIADISSLTHFEITQKKLSLPLAAQNSEAISAAFDLLHKYIHHYDLMSFTFNSKVRLLPENEFFFHIIPSLLKERFLEINELHFLAQITECYIETWPTFKKLLLPGAFSLDEHVKNLLQKKFLISVRNFIDQNGSVSYSRHPLLRALNEKLQKLEHELRLEIGKIAKDSSFSSRLQFDSYDIINDRYVLAVRSDSYHFDLGPIISRSQSGMTLFVEPHDVREKANRRIYLLAEIQSAILKLTIDLSKIAHTFFPAFQTISALLLELDWLNTKATYSLKKNLSRPLLNEEFSFEFRGLFHPLLKNPVKNDILLNSKSKGLVISGPNTGGKTVVLKSMTLSLFFVHLGLFVPAVDANIHPVSHLFYFSHDHQNLSQGLSSFASEAKYYLELLTSLGESNLIFIDEIFNSTSSEEASALAISFLQEIHALAPSKIVLSTHHQILKTFMHSRPDYISAHMGYDLSLNRPTYRLISGEPGSSHAFKIFETLSATFNIKNNISDRAKTLLDNKHNTYESLLQELSLKKIELDKLLSANEKLQVELKNKKSSMEGTLFLEKEKILLDYTKKIKRLFHEAEDLLPKIRNEKITTSKNLNRDILSIQKSLKENSLPQKNDENTSAVYQHLHPISFEDISLDSVVFSLTLKKNVRVAALNLRKKEIQIQHGALSFWVAVETLRYPSGKNPPPIIQINIEKKIRGEIEIDCRGMRLDEFQKIVADSLNEIENNEIPFITIIHGHGDGVLKNWLRAYLNKRQADFQWENINGNDGCTKIFL